ncbi:unnamed protein product [Gulo gulo]|uniref:Uncharacterized protein n=1 Tax=Gulo gulo TaxID=48420 RepID=A0A9X9M1B6_GULGU|nr:unnamed protein product [Gulo gulo]
MCSRCPYQESHPPHRNPNPE